jgi:hypothetical protein
VTDASVRRRTGPRSAIARFGHGFWGLLGGTLHENAVADRQKEPRVVLLFVGATLAVYTTLGLGFVWL